MHICAGSPVQSLFENVIGIKSSTEYTCLLPNQLGSNDLI